MNKKRRLSAGDWVALGIAELAAHGPEAIKLEAICTAAGLTRGSFYHHFADHNDFLQSIVVEWSKQSTDDVLQGLPPTDDAKEAASRLTSAALGLDLRLELGIRELARRVPEITEVVRQTDETRLDALAKLYVARFGLDEPVAQDLAFLEYAAFSGMILLKPAMAEDAQHRLAAHYDSLIAKALLTAGP